MGARKKTGYKMSAACQAEKLLQITGVASEDIRDGKRLSDGKVAVDVRMGVWTTAYIISWLSTLGGPGWDLCAGVDVDLSGWVRPYGMTLTGTEIWRLYRSVRKVVSNAVLSSRMTCYTGPVPVEPLGGVCERTMLQAIAASRHELAFFIRLINDDHDYLEPWVEEIISSNGWFWNLSGGILSLSNAAGAGSGIPPNHQHLRVPDFDVYFELAKDGQMMTGNSETGSYFHLLLDSAILRFVANPKQQYLEQLVRLSYMVKKRTPKPLELVLKGFKEQVNGETLFTFSRKLYAILEHQDVRVVRAIFRGLVIHNDGVCY